MFPRLAIILLALLASSSAVSFELGWLGSYRANTHYQYFVWLPGENSTGTAYNDMFITSTERWRQAHLVPITFDIVIEERPRCIPDGSPSGRMEDNPGVVAWAPSSLGDDGLPVIATCRGHERSAAGYAPGYPPAAGSIYALLPDGSAPDQPPITHEIGHNLGLGHTVVGASIMRARPDAGYLRHLIGRATITSDDICGLAVIHGVMEKCSAPWQYAATLTGAPTTAMFVGGATTDFGLTYTSEATSGDYVEVYGTFVTDPLHHLAVGGHLHVLAESAGAMYALVAPDQDAAFYRQRLPRSRWVPIELGENPVIPAAESVAQESWSILGAAHNLLIFSATMVQLYGGYHRNVPDSLSVRFWLAYSLDGIPGEYFYSPTPIELEWRK